MDAIGYSLTWRTRCFIQGGCDQPGLFGHTNGYGDFVLFDRLGWPWPLHECYVRRFDLATDADVLGIRGSRTVAATDLPSRGWDCIKSVEADPEEHRSGVSIIGTVTNIEQKFIGRSKEFAGISKRQKAEIEKTLASRRSFVVLADGDGQEFGMFADLEKWPVRFRDTVAAKLKVVTLMNKHVFVATQLRVFRFDGY